MVKGGDTIYTVSVEIPVDASISTRTIFGTDVFGLQEKIEMAIGECDSSGCGFGYRDFQVSFNTHEEASVAAGRAKEILKEAGFEIGDGKNQAVVRLYEAIEYEEDEE